MPGLYKLLCIDLDGTLLDSNSELSDFSVSVVKKAQEKGAIVCATSGRLQWQIAPYVHKLGLNTPMVASNGAHVYDPAKDEYWMRADLPVEETLKYLKFCIENNFRWYLYGHCSISSPVDDAQDPWHKRFYAFIRTQGTPLPDRYLVKTEQDCIDALERGCGKLSVKTDQAGLDLISGYYKINRPGTVCKKAAEGLMETMNEKASKWDAIKLMAKSLGVPEEQICVFGDNMNDFEMIKGCKTSFAMKNGDERIFPYATRVIGANFEDGVAHAIEEYILDNIIS